MASVQTNDTLLPPFSLQRGTRQGCLLSPLLFALAIQSLSGCALRKVLKVSAVYRHPNLPKVTSGRCVSSLVKQLPHFLTSFKWTANRFHYLGIFITTSMSDMFRDNFLPLIEKAERDFDHWSILPLSLMCQINLIKMVVLPKFLYLFQHVTIFITKSFFDKLDRMISKFLWGNKPAQIQKAILQSPKSDGGLALPNLRRFYWAANVQKLLQWINNECDSLPA